MSELEMTQSKMEEYDPCNTWFDMPKRGGFEWEKLKNGKRGARQSGEVGNIMQQLYT